MKKKKIDKISKDIPINNTELLDMSRIGIGGSQTTSNNDNVSGYPVKVTLYVRRDGLNTYYVKSTVTTRWGNFNNYGMVSKVCSNTSGSANSEWVRKATTTSFSEGHTLIAEKTVNVGSSGTFYGVSRCTHCEYGSPHSAKFAQVTPGISYTYENPTIIPGKPNTGRPSNAKFNDGIYDVYAGGNIAITNSGGSNVVSRKIDLECYYPSSGWATWTPNASFNSWSGASGTLSASFDGTGNNRGYIYRVTCHTKSSTGHTASNTTYYFKVNDLPNSGNFSGNTSRTRDEVTISWSAPIDKLNEGSFRYQIANYKNGSYTIISESSGGSSKKISLLAAGASKGETVTLKMRVKDYLEYGPWSSGSVTVKMNSDPYFDANSIITSDKDSAHYNKYFDAYINFTFPIIRDADTTTGSQYRIEYSVHNGTSWGSWVHLENRTSSAYNKNFASIVPRGHKLRLQVKPVDDLGAIGAGKISQTYTRVELPQPPSSMIFHSQKFKDEHYETLEKVSWSKGHSTCGKIDRYKCILQAIGANGSVSRESVYETSLLEASPSLSFINRGENFRIRIQAKDIFGNWSSTISSGLHSRNKVPNKVSNFKTTGNKTNFYNTVPLVWDISSDSDGDSVTYEIYHRTELGPWRLVAERISKGNYSHSIPGYNPGVKLGYKIVPVDELGAKGTETVLANSDNITVNTPPTACIPFAPFDSPVFSKRPRLLIERVVEDKDKDDLILEVVLDGVTYTSSANPELFNKRVFSSTEKASFRPPHDLTPGSHLVKFRTYDGMQYSPAVQETIEIRAMLENNKAPRVDYITASSINKCCQMLETNYVAYKESPRRKTFIKGSAITASQINSIYKDAYDLTKHITSLSNGLNDPHSLIVSSRHNKIGTDWFNKMIKIIETL